MGVRRPLLPGAFLFVVAGCSAVSPDPEEMASHLPPERELSPVQAAQVGELSDRAIQLLREGQFEDAEETALRALALQPRAARPRAVLGQCLLQRARKDDPPDLRLWRRAEGELLSATKAAPEDAVVMVMYARFLVEDGHLAAAAEIAEKALVLHPDDLPALRLAADTRYELGEERLARSHLARLVLLDPDPQHRYRLGWCLLRIAEGERNDRVLNLLDAAAEFQAYTESVPQDLEGHLARGRALFRAAEEAESDAERAARAEEAALVYSQAADRFPEAAAPLFGSGVCLELLDRSEQAIAAYEQALERDPRNVGALLNLASLLASGGQREWAEDLCRRALLEDLTSDERERVTAFLDGSELRLP